MIFAASLGSARNPSGDWMNAADLVILEVVNALHSERTIAEVYCLEDCTRGGCSLGSVGSRHIGYATIRGECH